MTDSELMVKWRELEGMNQTEMAVRMGVSHMTVYNYEREKSAVPKMAVELARIKVQELEEAECQS